MLRVFSKRFLQCKIDESTSVYVKLAKRRLQSGKSGSKDTKIVALKKYWFGRYVDYIKNYDKVLEKNFPRTMGVYRIFSVGTKELFSDLKKYIIVVKKRNIDGVDRLSRAELQLAHTMPKDLLKISPLLLISAIPFTNYVIFPLAYFFPRQLLTSHYWTLQQRSEFLIVYQKKRLLHNKPLLRCVQAQLDGIKDPKLRIKWSGVIACLGSGTHPTTSDIVACKDLFAGPPYSLEYLRRKHIIELLSIHQLSHRKFFKRHRLKEHGLFIKQMDEAIDREGGVLEMTNDAVKWAVSFRGINPTNLSAESMREWLEEWLILSRNVEDNNISLLLHAPILLAYNHPNNWILIYH